MVNNKCRICLAHDTFLIDIYNNQDSLTISEKIMLIAKIIIQPNDSLPSSICSLCNDKLEQCLDFIKLCEKSDVELRKSLDIKPATVNGDTLSCDFLNKESYVLKNKKVKVERRDQPLDDCNKELESAAKKQQCFTCGKVMSSRFRLKTHLATHSEHKPFTCQYCNKKFAIEQNLNVHLRIHTGEKPLQCTICGKKFAHSSGLTAHKRKHTGQTPYHCVLCPRKFRTIGHLNYHVRCHTGEKNYECDSCGRAFITRSDLKQHLIIHSGQKPHVCSVCGVGLSRASNLKRHMRHTHSEEKLFECTNCSSTFTRKSDLIGHEKSHEILN